MFKTVKNGVFNLEVSTMVELYKINISCVFISVEKKQTRASHSLFVLGCPGYPVWVFRGFCQSLQSYSGVLPVNRSRPFAATSIPSFHSQSSFQSL